MIRPAFAQPRPRPRWTPIILEVRLKGAPFGDYQYFSRLWVSVLRVEYPRGNRVQERKVECWDEFRELIDETLPGMRLEHEQANAGRPLEEPLFRGVGNSDWGLETTLERSIDAAHTETLGSYYKKIDRSKPAVESLTGREWLDIPDWHAFGAQLDPRSECRSRDRSHPVEQPFDLSVLDLPSTSWFSISAPGLDSIGVCSCTLCL